MQKSKSIENNSLFPNHLSDHGYEPTENLVFTLDQQYADDISWASTNKTVFEKIETIIPEVLKERNLFVNESKTEKYTVSRNSHEWKDCKLVGSKLETVNDIENRIKLVNYS